MAPLCIPYSFRIIAREFQKKKKNHCISKYLQIAFYLNKNNGNTVDENQFCFIFASRITIIQWASILWFDFCSSDLIISLLVIFVTIMENLIFFFIYFNLFVVWVITSFWLKINDFCLVAAEKKVLISF